MVVQKASMLAASKVAQMDGLRVDRWVGNLDNKKVAWTAGLTADVMEKK